MTPLKRKNLRRMLSQGLLLFKQKNGAPPLSPPSSKGCFQRLKNEQQKQEMGRKGRNDEGKHRLNLIELLATYLGA